MKATGIVRRIDSLGRVVIPKEIRKTLKIREGDSLEIFVDRDGEIIFKKYSHFIGLEDIAKGFTDSLFKALGHVACVADRDMIVAVSGAAKKDYLHLSICEVVELAMQNRRTVLLNVSGKDQKCKNCLKKVDCKISVIAPVVSNGDPVGAVILYTGDYDSVMGEIDIKLTETAADFLGRQVAE